MRRDINIWRSVDWITIVIFLVLVTIGWFNIYSAVYDEEHDMIFDFTQRYGKQFIWILATMVLAIFILLIDTRFYYFFAYFIYGGVIILLLLVLLVGREIYGARSWFEFGSLNIQPSEFAKSVTALALAFYINHVKHDLKKPKFFLTASGIIFLPAVLIAAQPDMGSAIVFFSLFIVLFREGMSSYFFFSGIIMVVLFFLSILFNNLYVTLGLIALGFTLALLVIREWKIRLTATAIFILIFFVLYFLNEYLFQSLKDEKVLFFSVIISGVAYGYYFYSKKAKNLFLIFIFLLGSLIFINFVDFAFNNLIKPHQKERVEIMLGIRTDPYGTGYNVNQSIISIGSGGFGGKGYLQGTQTKYKFVPAQSTDFIFCTIGEEWGFIGSLFIIALYSYFLLRLVFLAERQKSGFSRIYGYGVLSIIFAHFFVNIGMAVGLLPVIGIPLPFLSYGGSSMWGFTILLFVFLRFDASRKEYLV